MRSFFCRTALVALVCSFTLSGELHAQSREATRSPVVGLLASNALLGGLTAATRAFVAKQNVPKAFALGAFGGSIHFIGKLDGPRGDHWAHDWLGVATASLGTSIVHNAGEGAGPLREISVPIGVVRLRFITDTPRVRVALSLYEAFLVVRAANRSHLAFQWKESATTNSFVFQTQDRIVTDHKSADGIAWGPVVVISETTDDRQRTARHEAVHVQQYRFMHEAWGRPIEAYLRARIPYARRIPSWLELGVVPPALWALDYTLRGKGPLRSAMESEAGRLETQ